MTIDSVNLLANAPAATGADKAKPSAADFGEMLGGALQDVVAKQKTAETLTIQAAQGAPVPLQDVINAVNAAEITLQTMLTIRDRAVEAYQEVIRLPI